MAIVTVSPLGLWLPAGVAMGVRAGTGRTLGLVVGAFGYRIVGGMRGAWLHH